MDSVAILMRLRKLLAVTWQIGVLRELLAAQPILAVEGGHPPALHHQLEHSADLRSYLFYDAQGKLEPLWPDGWRSGHGGLDRGYGAPTAAGGTAPADIESTR
ncbi:hypothetical protein [Actinoplanes palleronii]|uniref:Uncharacterized protein n=1 Tax=Actinoplanes palleronii TaxID=113570 RepID=A0ABQ4BRL9_9ACTN|nr:hypothetical protein [Actinoplanes palleronii]GIE72880.1 hypothetical protein Apa02nite_089880 [Actinoplanes palleronii]